MSNSEAIWERIKQVISNGGLIDAEEIEKLEPRIESGRITSGDWKLAVENTLLKEEKDA
jgi:hypothetical protein